MINDIYFWIEQKLELSIVKQSTKIGIYKLKIYWLETGLLLSDGEKK